MAKKRSSNTARKKPTPTAKVVEEAKKKPDYIQTGAGAKLINRAKHAGKNIRKEVRRQKKAELKASKPKKK